MQRKNFTAAELKTVLSYDPDTGIFRRNKPWGSQNKGDEPGSISKQGYKQIGIFRNTYGAQTLAWLYVYGDWPNGIIDHINRNKLDNRIANLRLSDYSRNAHNADTRKNNASGVKGVYLHSKNKTKPWTASIMVGGKRIHLGTFSTLEEAAKVRLDAEIGIY